jgi:endonuclease/exonuclease/phosphatase family metal-dependent hydrolase
MFEQSFEGPRTARALGRLRRPGRRTAFALTLLAPWLIWAVVRTLGLETGGRLLPAMAFTPYVGLTAPLPLIVALLLRRWAVAALALVVVVAFALALIPRQAAGPTPLVRDGVSLRVMTANLYVGQGDPRTVVDLVRRHRVDVLALQELPPEELRRLDAAGLRRLLPYRDVDARPSAAGTGLFSRRPLRALPQINSINLMAEPRAALRLADGPDLEIGAVHPPPPINGQVGTWRHMLREIPPPDTSRPALRFVLGDFNATLDHHDLRDRLGDGGYVDAADAAGDGYDTTWPAGRRLPPEITIDHVLVDPRVAVRSVSVHTVPHSDHRAVIATLELPRAPR